MDCARCHKEIELKEIAFCPFCGHSLAAPKEERRKAIVVFCDVAGFTSLSQQTDPDELRLLIDDMMRRFTQIVVRHGGIVDKILGDGVMFLFGSESSSCDDPNQALNTVEGIQSELVKFGRERALDLALHFGISFGTVSVGEVGGSRTVMGEIVNLAQRLESISGKNEVIVSDAFASLFGSEHLFEPLPAVQLKGIREAVVPHRYSGRAFSKPVDPPFVGREEDIRKLRTALQEFANDSKGCRWIVTGPAGIGKTRIVSEACGNLETIGLTSFTLSFDDGGSSFHRPFRTLVDQLLGHPHWSDSPELSKHRAFLESVTLWNHLDFADLGKAVRAALKAAASHRPIVVVTENVDRAAPSALFFLKDLQDRLMESRLFWLSTARTSIDGMGELIRLGPLAAQEARELFAHVAGAKRRPSGTVAEAIDQCGGNPLFLRELARGAGDSLHLEKLLAGRVEILIEAALDLLPEDLRELVKAASVFGSRVPIHALSRVTGETERTLISRLSATHLLEPLTSTDTFHFRHDLYRESAYGRINLRARRNWHKRIGDALVEEAAYAEEIAHHFLASDDRENALRFSLEAGRRLSRLPRQDEALSYLSSAERLARELRDSSSLLSVFETRFAVESRGKGVGESLELVQRWMTDPLLETNSKRASHFSMLRARFLFDRRQFKEAHAELHQLHPAESPKCEIGDELLRCRLLFQFQERKEVVRRGLALLRRSDLSSSDRGAFFLLLGSVSYTDEELDQAEDLYRKALEAYQNADDQEGLQKTLGNLGNIAHFRGKLTQARDHFLEGSRLALELGNVCRYADTLRRLGMTNFDLLRFEEALSNYEQAMTILSHDDSEGLYHQIRLAYSAALCYLGETERAQTHLEGLLRFYEAAGEPLNLGQAIRTRALIERDRGDLEHALVLIEKTIPLHEPQANQLQLDHLLRIELLHLLNRKDEAKKSLALFLDRHDPKILFPSAQEDFLRVASLVSERKEMRILETIEEYLCETDDRPHGTTRLPLIVEALEYGSSPHLLAEAERLKDRLREALPERYRSHFDRKPYVQRLESIRGPGTTRATRPKLQIPTPL